MPLNFSLCVIIVDSTCRPLTPRASNVVCTLQNMHHETFNYKRQ